MDTSLMIHLDMIENKQLRYEEACAIYDGLQEQMDVVIARSATIDVRSCLIDYDMIDRYNKDEPKITVKLNGRGEADMHIVLMRGTLTVNVCMESTNKEPFITFDLARAVFNSTDDIHTVELNADAHKRACKLVAKMKGNDKFLSRLRQILVDAEAEYKCAMQAYIAIIREIDALEKELYD